MRKEIIEVGDEYGPEYNGKYVFSEITWAKRSRIIQKYTHYSQQTGQVVASDYVAIQAETIMASLKEQPPNKPITLEKLLSEEDGVPIELGELFSQIVNRLNAVGLEETAFLSEQSDAKSQTKHSQSSAFAKSSGGHQTSLLNSQPKQFSSSSSSSTS